MLWKKESQQPDALYIDIFKPNAQHWDAVLNSKLHTIDQSAHPEKSNAIALEKRNEGNKKFPGSVLSAMESYTNSLRFAEPRSEHISLAYANRAACFLKIKMYDECLVDIENAMAAGYPEHLLSKLDERKDRCLKEMQADPQYPCDKLSIEPNEMFPCLSNMAKVRRNGKADYSVVATTDIDVGQPIVIENGYSAFVSRNLGIHCNICTKSFGNLMPCDRCAVAMFCPECEGHFLHEHECGLNVCGASDFNYSILCAVRGILLVLEMFATADQLMVFVEKMLKRPNELPTSMLDDRSTYQMYFNCPIKANVESLGECKPKLYAVYKTLLRIPHVAEMFKTTKHRRFLTHLIGHHATIAEVPTGFGIIKGQVNPLIPTFTISPLMHSCFKHSCTPNVFKFTNGGKTVWLSMKPIKSGEELFVSYAPFEMETEERQALLLGFNLKCECSRCRGITASPAQRHRLFSDPAFQFVMANMKSIFPLRFNTEPVTTMMDALAQVLRHCGQMEWCDEMGYAIKCFQTLCNFRMIGGGTDFQHPLTRAVLMLCNRE